MKFYKILPLSEKQGEAMYVSKFAFKNNEKTVFQCKKIDDWKDDNIIYIHNKTTDLEVGYEAGTRTIFVSDKVKTEIIKHEIGWIQFLPIHIRSKHNKDKDIWEYYLINALHSVSWLIDEEKTTRSTILWRTFYAFIRLRREKVKEVIYDVFRVDEEKREIRFSEKMKRLFDKYKNYLEYYEQ